jgi:hypothetical protein
MAGNTAKQETQECVGLWGGVSKSWINALRFKQSHKWFLTSDILLNFNVLIVNKKTLMHLVYRSPHLYVDQYQLFQLMWVFLLILDISQYLPSYVRLYWAVRDISLNWIDRLNIEQSHKWFWHNNFTQNLKALGLWVLSLINAQSLHILTNVGLPHTTHTCFSQQ